MITSIGMQSKISTLLGFDFGMKSIGVAVGQTVTKTAKMLTALRAQQGVPDWRALAQLIDEWHPDVLVVGLPLNMDGTEQDITKNAREFAQVLSQRFGLPVYFADERLTTVEARDRLFSEHGYKALQKSAVDALSAQLILEAWMLENII